MPCKHYKDALIEAAASGAEPQGELRAHLEACATCRAAFEQERTLFSSIDASLRLAANAEVPASLLPRVRARLDEESAPRRIWLTNWLVLASAAVLVAAFFTVRAVLRTSAARQPFESTGKSVVPPRVTTPPRIHDPKTEMPVGKNNASNHQFVITKNRPLPESRAEGKRTPEVLVPRDQEVLLAEYANQWRLQKRAPLLTQDADATVLAPLQIAQIQIAELGVKLLADEKSQ